MKTKTVGRLARLSCKLLGHRWMPLTKQMRVQPIEGLRGHRASLGLVVIGRGCSRCDLTETYAQTAAKGEN